jgi:hypothetical protein
MARKFKKNPSMTMVYVPGFGRLMGDTIIEGDQYARFAPAILVEVAEADLPKPAALPPPPLAVPVVPDFVVDPVVEVVAPILVEVAEVVSPSQEPPTVEDSKSKDRDDASRRPRKK